MRFPLALLLVAGCGAELGPGGNQADANRADSRNADTAIVMVDARSCAGGDIAQVGPDGSCFVFVGTPVTYNAAKAACLAMNAHLAYLKTAAIDTFAEQFIGTANTWVGGNDLVTEMAFQWDDGTAFSFTNWHTGEPNNGGGGAYQEDCVIIAGARVDKQWDDRPCDASEVPSSGTFAYLCNY